MPRSVQGFIPVVSITTDMFYPVSAEHGFPSQYFEGADTPDLMIAAWETLANESPDDISTYDQVGIYDLAKGKIVKVFKFGLMEIE